MRRNKRNPLLFENVFRSEINNLNEKQVIIVLLIISINFYRSNLYKINNLNEKQVITFFN